MLHSSSYSRGLFHWQALAFYCRNVPLLCKTFLPISVLLFFSSAHLEKCSCLVWIFPSVKNAFVKITNNPYIAELEITFQSSSCFYHTHWAEVTTPSFLKTSFSQLLRNCILLVFLLLHWSFLLMSLLKLPHLPVFKTLETPQSPVHGPLLVSTYTDSHGDLMYHGFKYCIYTHDLKAYISEFLPSPLPGLGMEPRALSMPNNCSTTRLHPQTLAFPLLTTKK